MSRITNLKEYQIKGVRYEGIDSDDGLITQTSESGAEFNIVRWTTHMYALTLQYLEFSEINEIVKELIEFKKNAGVLLLPKNILESKGYIDFKKLPHNPTFNYSLKEVKPAHQSGTQFYELSLKLRERVDEYE